MSSGLAAIITSISVLALTAIAIWRPNKVISAAAQVLALLVLLGIVAAASESFARVALVTGSCILITIYQRQGRFTRMAAMLAAGIGILVITQYPPSWTVAIAFIFGWANFLGGLNSEARVGDESGTRDMADLAPAAAVVLFGATFVDTNPDTAIVIVFSALAFIANDVLASDLGPELPGRAYLLPHIATVPHGTPGAMSYAGTLVGSFGSLSAGLCAGSLLYSPSLGAVVFVAGSAGAAVDTALSRSDVRSAMRRGRELINVAGCLAAVGVGFLGVLALGD